MSCDKECLTVLARRIETLATRADVDLYAPSDILLAVAALLYDRAREVSTDPPDPGQLESLWPKCPR